MWTGRIAPRVQSKGGRSALQQWQLLQQPRDRLLRHSLLIDLDLDLRTGSFGSMEDNGCAVELVEALMSCWWMPDADLSSIGIHVP